MFLTRFLVFTAIICHSMVMCVEPTHNMLQRYERAITVTTEPARKIPTSFNARAAHSHEGHNHSGHTHATPIARRRLATRRPSGQFKLRH